MAYATDDDEALREAMNLGVEHEGIEAAQLLGLVAATLIAIVVLVVTLMYFLITPSVQGNQAAAEQIGLYPELASTRANGIAQIREYAVASPEEGTYRIPVADAGRLVTRRYAQAQAGVTGLVQPPDHYALGGVTSSPAGSVVSSISGRGISGTPPPDERPSLRRPLANLHNYALPSPLGSARTRPLRGGGRSR